MVEDFRQLDERHFSVGSCQIDNPPAECLAEGVGGEVPSFDLVAYLDELEMAVHHLVRDDAAEPVEETRLADVTDLQRHVALTDEVLEALVYPDLPPLAGLLFIDGETVPRQELLPRKSGQVRETEPEEAAAADKEG